MPSSNLYLAQKSPVFFLCVVLLFVSVVALIKTLQQGQQIKVLEERVRMLLFQMMELKPAKKDSPLVVKEEKKETTSEEQKPIISVKEEVIITTEVPLPKVDEMKKEELLPPSTDWQKQIFTPKPRRTNAEWEALIGGKILNRIGALALIIGIGFFLKYAFDNNWITETMRVGIGFFIGALLLFGGNYYHKKDFQVFSQGLISAGIATLYLSVYASFNYYHLVSQIIAMLMMSAVTLITFWQAFKYDSLVIGIFGWLGGFLTPILLSTGNANETGLFSYIAMLDAGLLVIILRKEKWFVLEPLTLLATIIMYAAWYSNDFSEDKIWITTSFLILFWAMFLAVELYRIYRTEKPILLLHQLVSLGNGAFFFIALYAMIDTLHHKWMGLITADVAAVYLGVYLFTKSRRAGNEQVLIRYLLSAILLTVIASLIQFEKYEISIAFAIESLVLIAFAARYKHLIVLYCAIANLGFSFLNLIVSVNVLYIDPTVFHLFFNMRALALVVMTVSAIGSSLLSRKIENKNSYLITSAFTYAAVLSFFLLITLETTDYFNQLSATSQSPWNNFFDDNLGFVLAIEWLSIAMPLLFFGVRRKNESLFIAGLILTGITISRCILNALSIYAPMELYVPVLNIRTLALLFVAICLFIQTRWIEKETLYPWLDKLANAIRVVMVGVIFIFLTVEMRDIFEQKIFNAHLLNVFAGSQIESYRNQQQISISGVWLFYSMLLMVIGIYRSRLNIRIVAIVVFGITISKVFFCDLSYLDTLHRIFSFIALGVILLLVSFLYQKYKHLIVAEKK